MRTQSNRRTRNQGGKGGRKQPPVPKTGPTLHSGKVRTVLKAAEAPSFHEWMEKEFRLFNSGTTGSSKPVNSLSEWDYKQELELKDRAFLKFWREAGLPDKPNKILASPKPRRYRTTSKRAVLSKSGKFHLEFSHPGMDIPKTSISAESARMEPEAHSEIYGFLEEKLNLETYSILGHNLNYLIIRGSYTQFSVILNLRKTNAAIVRKAKMLGEHLQRLEQKVISAFLFLDPSQSRYYLDNRQGDGQWKLKKLFGPDKLFLKVGSVKYSFYPTSFSQINESILPVMLEKVAQMLKPLSHQRLLDLYCGYGLFSHFLSNRYATIIGIDSAGPSIRAAIENLDYNPSRAKVRFHPGNISPALLEKSLPPIDTTPESLVLDPPRQGTESGVIRALAGRHPSRVVHVFCNPDLLPREISAWRKNGYMVSKVQPLDLFPGTDKLEVLVLFLKDQYGILNRISTSSSNSRTTLKKEPN